MSANQRVLLVAFAIFFSGLTITEVARSLAQHEGCIMFCGHKP